LFGADESADLGLLSFEEERRQNLANAEQALVALLEQRTDVDYEDARTVMLNSRSFGRGMDRES
jgi:hypothetical protein